MLAGVLVIAFPVSVFSELWSDELKEVKGFESMIEVDSDNTTNGVSDNMKSNGKQKNKVIASLVISVTQDKDPSKYQSKTMMEKQS